MDLISVIVPVYKVEKYLDRCVQSIVDQTYSNLEIILVDDGSPDNCGAMCDAWAEKDSRIKVIHKENGGGGDARNAALAIAVGDYIGLIDSDDYIEPHMYEHLLSLIQGDVDIAECGMKETEIDDELLDDASEYETEEYGAKEAMKLHIADQMFRQTPPNKLYRRSTIGDIKFPIGKRIDDEFWTYQVIANARRLVHTSCNMYAYRQQADSVMHLSFALERLQVLDAKCERLKLLEMKFPELIPFAKINLWCTCLYMGQMSMRHLKRENRKTSFEKINVVLKQHPLNFNEKKKLSMQQCVWICMSEASFEITCRLRNFFRIGF